MVSSKRKVKTNFETSKFDCVEGSLEDVLRMSLIHPESTYKGRPLNVRLGRPLDVISGRPRNVRSGRPRDVQIGSLGNLMGNNISRLGID